jgi:hypothetical protein
VKFKPPQPERGSALTALAVGVVMREPLSSLCYQGKCREKPGIWAHRCIAQRQKTANGSRNFAFYNRENIRLSRE